MRFFPTLMILCLCPPVTYGAVVEYTVKSAWEIAAGNYSTITFTELPVNTLVTNQYTHLGVLFTDNSDYIFQNSNFLNDGFGLNGAFDNIWLQFSQPMNWIAVDYPGIVRFYLYNSGQLIYQSSDFFAPGSGAGGFAGLISDASFDRVLITDPSGDVFIDDLHFGPAIPAPGALALAVIAGVMLSRRRRGQ